MPYLGGSGPGGSGSAYARPAAPPPPPRAPVPRAPGQSHAVYTPPPAAPRPSLSAAIGRAVSRISGAVGGAVSHPGAAAHPLLQASSPTTRNLALALASRGGETKAATSLAPFVRGIGREVSPWTVVAALGLPKRSSGYGPVGNSGAWMFPGQTPGFDKAATVQPRTGPTGPHISHREFIQPAPLPVAPTRFQGIRGQDLQHVTSRTQRGRTTHFVPPSFLA